MCAIIFLFKLYCFIINLSLIGMYQGSYAMCKLRRQRYKLLHLFKRFDRITWSFYAIAVTGLTSLSLLEYLEGQIVSEVH